MIRPTKRSKHVQARIAKRAKPGQNPVIVVQVKRKPADWAKLVNEARRKSILLPTISLD